ncbi:hypothetical protein DX914_06870 [Lysobacter silvisoli]|uniref:Uncharacterized protein n=1 Tax=Lysobacter silvisoli TaxID=2293254 RepID=A0A371K4Q3_9GAMM|nr:hypothetical protein DX914_06870 [Lysobacter silvisoli]
MALPACAAKPAGSEVANTEAANAQASAPVAASAAAPQAAAAAAPAPASADSKQAFSGQWAYRQSCGWQHTAHLDIAESGNSASGSWDDGTRANGDSGQLQGELRDGRLYLRLCSEGQASGKIAACPNFGEASAYVVREGAILAWYRKSGEAYRPYLKLHPAGAGQTVPDDTTGCEEDAADD